jgi:SAM-dependent methyltransferase
VKTCPICSSQKCAVFDDSRTPRLLICAICRHLFWDKTPTQNELNQFYQAVYTPTHQQDDIQASHREYYRGHVDELARMLGKEKPAVSLADFGCSFPVLLEEAQKQGVGKLLGIDLDQASRDYGVARDIPMMTPDEFFRDVPDNTIDIIRFSHVLEHLIDPVATIVRAVAKLAPGGLLYITQPNFPVLRAAQTNYHIKDSVYPTHLHYFSPISIGCLLERCPVRVEKFFTVTNHDETFAAIVDLFDRDYAEKRLKPWQARGDASRGERANYPVYCGENSALYAVKTAATPPRMSTLARFVARVWGKMMSNNRTARAECAIVRR